MTDDIAFAPYLRHPGTLQLPGEEQRSAGRQAYFIELIVSSSFGGALCIDLFFSGRAMALDPHPLVRQQSYATWEPEA